MQISGHLLSLTAHDLHEGENSYSSLPLDLLITIYHFRSAFGAILLDLSPPRLHDHKTLDICGFNSHSFADCKLLFGTYLNCMLWIQGREKEVGYCTNEKTHQAPQRVIILLRITILRVNL
jgi:hypothetical protein